MKLCWNSLPPRRAIVYHKCYYYCREMQNPHPWHSSLASSIWIICRLLNNSAWQARCLTLLNHSNKLKTQCTVFWDDLLGSDLFVFHIVFEFPPSLLGASLFPYSEEVHGDGTSEDRDHDYYNAIPGKQPPAGGISDVRIKVQTTDQMAYCPIRCEKLCYLVSNVDCYWYQRCDSVLTSRILDLMIFQMQG